MKYKINDADTTATKVIGSMSQVGVSESQGPILSKTIPWIKYRE